MNRPLTVVSVIHFSNNLQRPILHTIALPYRQHVHNNIGHDNRKVWLQINNYRPCGLFLFSFDHIVDDTDGYKQDLCISVSKLCNLRHGTVCTFFLSAKILREDVGIIWYRYHDVIIVKVIWLWLKFKFIYLLASTKNKIVKTVYFCFVR